MNNNDTAIIMIGVPYSTFEVLVQYFKKRDIAYSSFSSPMVTSSNTRKSYLEYIISIQMDTNNIRSEFNAMVNYLKLKQPNKDSDIPYLNVKKAFRPDNETTEAKQDIDAIIRDYKKVPNPVNRDKAKVNMIKKLFFKFRSV